MIAVLYMWIVTRIPEVAVVVEILTWLQFSQNLCCNSHKIFTKSQSQSHNRSRSCSPQSYTRSCGARSVTVVTAVKS